MSSNFVSIGTKIRKERSAEIDGILTVIGKNRAQFLMDAMDFYLSCMRLTVFSQPDTKTKLTALYGNNEDSDMLNYLSIMPDKAFGRVRTTDSSKMQQNARSDVEDHEAIV